MPDLAKIEAVAAKLGPSEGAESASETAAAPPAGGPSGAGSAPADGGASPTQSGETALKDPSPGAPNTASEIERKLAADRARRAEKARRRQADEDATAAKKAREEAEQAKKDAEAERAKFANLGKGRPFLETIRELGLDPRQTFEAMREEALKAGTPEARFEAMEKAWGARFESMDAALKSEREARENERKEREAERSREQQTNAERGFQHAFEKGISDSRYESLLEEYPAEHLFGIVKTQRDNPEAFLAHARATGVRLQWEEHAAARMAAGEDLTDEEPTFTMLDILNVLKATQDRHFARLEEQRRKKQAASQTAPEAPAKKAPVATRPTVNGTAERNAGSSLGNNIAATTAAGEAPKPRASREEKVKRLGEKYG